MKPSGSIVFPFVSVISMCIYIYCIYIYIYTISVSMCLHYSISLEATLCVSALLLKHTYV